MRARCAQCLHVFSAEGDGIQICPNCGAELALDIPRAPFPEPPQGSFAPPAQPSAGARAMPPPGGDPAFFPPAPGPERTPTPWERRAQIGFFKGLFDTIALSLKRPADFFSSMPICDASGAITYYWLLAGISVVMSSLWTALFSVLSGDAAERLAQLEELTQAIGGMDGTVQSLFETLLPMLQASANPGATLLCQVVGALLFTPIQLLIAAGICHLSALVLGAAQNGFNATLRALGYAAAPLLLSAIPACGAAVGGLAWIAFAIVGLARLQQITYAKAALVYFLPTLFCCACSCASIFGLFGLSLGNLSGLSP